MRFMFSRNTEHHISEPDLPAQLPLEPLWSRRPSPERGRLQGPSQPGTATLARACRRRRGSAQKPSARGGRGVWDLSEVLISKHLM